MDQNIIGLGSLAHKLSFAILWRLLSLNILWNKPEISSSCAMQEVMWTNVQIEIPNKNP